MALVTDFISMTHVSLTSKFNNINLEVTYRAPLKLPRITDIVAMLIVTYVSKAIKITIGACNLWRQGSMSKILSSCFKLRFTA